MPRHRYRESYPLPSLARVPRKMDMGHRRTNGGIADHQGQACGRHAAGSIPVRSKAIEADQRGYQFQDATISFRRSRRILNHDRHIRLTTQNHFLAAPPERLEQIPA